MIDNVRKTVHDFLEKNNRGWIQPERFNRYCYLAQIEIFESYFYDYNRWINMQNKRMSNTEYSDIPENIRQKLDIFRRESDLTYDTDLFLKPSDSYRVVDIYYNGKLVDKVTNSRARRLNSSNLTAPSNTYPICVENEDGIVVYPSTIIDDVEADYIRVPSTPKWTYNVVSGNPVFNPSNPSYQDFEIHPSDEHKIIVKILSYCGVTVGAQEVIQYAEGQQSKELNEENRA